MRPRPPARSDAPTEQLEGPIERVTFHSEETGFTVLRVKVKGQREPVAVVGRLPYAVPGEWVTARGQWTVNREHGRQFAAEHLESHPPDSLAGIEKFLGSGLIQGIGPVYAAKLVEKFGEDTFDVIENRSALLEKVEGIGTVRRQRIKDGWNQARAVRGIMTFLLGHGVSTGRAFRIYKVYGDQAIQRVQENPYCLARDIKGIGFKTADQIAEHFGVEKTSDLRARAGVEHVLQECIQEGHCAYPRRELLQRASEILEIPEPIIDRAIDHGVETRRLVLDRSPDGIPVVYTLLLHHAEVGLSRHLATLASGPHPCPAIQVEKAIAWSEEKMKISLSDSQREALRQALASKVMVITGGPGVGKTTLINALTGILAAKKLRIVMCAPTGRAAKRMSEAAGRPAKTIHRLLAFDPKHGGFRHDHEHPLKGDVFVVDEASMIDLPLAHSLVRAVPTGAALVVVGDVDQLPSVGPGNVLKDVIRSGCVPVCRLTQVFRQAAQSRIITNAHRVNRGELPVWASSREPSDFYVAEAEDPDRAAALIVRMVSRSIPERFGTKPADIQVLTPMQRGVLGARNLNVLLQQALNPSREELERFGTIYRTGDRVMQVENNYDKDVFNGDIGHILRMDGEDREVVVRFGSRDIVYDFNEMDELIPSYAVTIHKSQGSEYPCVVIAVHTQHFVMLQRNLLYTAMTRGRKLVVLVGTTKALAIAVKRNEARERLSLLCPRLQGVMEGR